MTKTEQLQELESSLEGMNATAGALAIWKFMLENRYSEEVSLALCNGSTYLIMYKCPDTETYAAYVGKTKAYANMSSIEAIRKDYLKRNRVGLEMLQENVFK